MVDLPFCHLDTENFKLALHELEHGQINFDQDGPAALTFNPFQLNTKNHLTLNQDIDPDNNAFQHLNKFPCDYYIADQFNKMFTEESRTAKTKFSFLHLNIRSIYQNLSQLTDLLLSLDHQFRAIGISETWLKYSSHIVDIENYNFIHKHRKNRAGGGVGLYLSNDIDYKFVQI